jgi:hypothetical protein
MLRSSSPDATAAAGPVSGTKHQIVSPARAISDFARVLRLRCMRRREISLHQLAADSGVPEARLRKFLSNDIDTVRQPNLSEALSIWGALDAAAVSASLGAIGMQASDNEADDETLGEALADMLDAGADLARVAENGAIDAAEADKAEHAADIVIERAQLFRDSARTARQR